MTILAVNILGLDRHSHGWHLDGHRNAGLIFHIYEMPKKELCR